VEEKKDGVKVSCVQSNLFSMGGNKGGGGWRIGLEDSSRSSSKKGRVLLGLEERQRCKK